MTIETPLPCALTVDVEDWFQVSAFDHVFTREDWDTLELRVEANTRRLLDLFDEFEVKGTFFVLGWVAERCPALIRDMHAAGHEVASHGYEHRLVSSLDPERFRADLQRAKQALTAAAPVDIVGFRAPSFSITPDSLWAFDVLREEGYTWSSSVFPVRHDRYGLPSFPRQPVLLEDYAGRSIWEFPMTTWRVLGRNLPVAGGGWMRALPPGVMHRALRAAQQEGVPTILYLHPWEIDPDQPKVPQVGRSARFRHYLNLEQTLPRLRRLLTEFQFGPVRDALAAVRARGLVAAPMRPSDLATLVAP
jgi:polysaccharide deacetylase family protein (PEP-CTERM system associated)